MKTFDLEIVTPESRVFSGPVKSVKVPGSMGSFQVLVNHAPIISTLGEGKVKIVKENGDTLEYHTKDGVIEVLKNKTIILVEQLLEDE
ncbi:MAG: ATP synthase F1 subunit epsilon [Bacteroidia bacterium]